MPPEYRKIVFCCLCSDSEFVPTDCPFPVAQWIDNVRPHYSGDKPYRNLTGFPEAKLRSYQRLIYLHYDRISSAICQCKPRENLGKSGFLQKQKIVRQNRIDWKRKRNLKMRLTKPKKWIILRADNRIQILCILCIGSRCKSWAGPLL